MDKNKGKPDALKKCLRESMDEIRGLHPRKIDVVFESMDLRKIREAHSKYAKKAKSYFPINIVGMKNGSNVTFFVDDHDVKKIEEYASGANDCEELKDLAYALRYSSLEKEMGKDHKMNISAISLKSLDRRFGDLFRYAALSELIECQEGIPDSTICVSIKERATYAYKMTLSYFTITQQGSMDGLGLAMFHAALDIGYGFGLPILPLRSEIWMEKLGMRYGFPELAMKTYDFIAFDNYLTSFFPNMSLENREELQSNFEERMLELRSHSDMKIPKHILEQIGMKDDEVKKRINEVGLVFG